MKKSQELDSLFYALLFAVVMAVLLPLIVIYFLYQLSLNFWIWSQSLINKRHTREVTKSDPFVKSINDQWEKFKMKSK